MPDRILTCSSPVITNLAEIPCRASRRCSSSSAITRAMFRVPAARDCGNYLDMNLLMAKYLAGKFYDEVL